MTRFPRLVALVVILGTVLGCGARPDPEAERRREEERAVAHQAAYTEGLAHLEAGSYDAAVEAFEKASALAPNDSDTAHWLGRARAAKHKHATEQYEKAMTTGRDAATAGKHRAAKAAFTDALRWKPNDPDATAAQAREEVPALVEQGQEQFDAKQFAEATRTLMTAAGKAPADAAIRDLLKKAQDARRAEVREEYEKALTAGRAAMGTRNFADAIGWFAAAEKLVPGDATATAEKQAAHRADVEDRYEKAMAAGRAAMTEKNYAAAARSFATAAELKPGDKAALAEKLTADFENHIRRGEDARAANRHAEAVSEFEQAARLKPQDERAKALVAAARQAKADADRARYNQVLTEAKTAMTARRYRDAVRLAKQAEEIIFNHSEATEVRRNAERVISEYDQWINKARSAIQRKRYDEAITAADEAGRLMPGETDPVLLRSEATRKKLDKK